MKKILLSVLLFLGLTENCASMINIYIKNNAGGGSNATVIAVLGRRGGSGDWTTLWGGNQTSQSYKNMTFGQGETIKFSFSNLGMNNYKIRFNVKQGESNSAEYSWEGALKDGSTFSIEPQGRSFVLNKKS